ncbi:hypothetical protein K7432_012505 [Basidiobolus ranarum]|uniref:MIT domain-containing protein n=1 Tax=Basidiobolus ranarum TaxID=34480 RepID=A0ABR2VS56_9FUNG
MATSTKTTTSASLPSNHPNTSPKTLLTIALSKAQDAVQLDGQKKMDEAIMAYQEAADLLSQVMDRAENANNRKKLRQIHQTYTNRIFLLNNSKNSLPNSPGPTSTYNTNGPTLAQTSANRNEESRDKMQTSNIHNLRKKMSAPLLRTSNETRFTTEDSKFSPYLQFSNGFQTSLHPNPPNSDTTSAGFISSRDNNGKNLPGVPESPLTHLLPPTSARLTALSKQLYGPNSVYKETEDTSRVRGESFSERTLPS